MPYPETLNISEKSNYIEVTNPDKQLSAQEVNDIVAAINANALFHGKHADEAALILAHAAPPLGAWAYIDDGTKYECKTAGVWTAQSSGGGSSSIEEISCFVTLVKGNAGNWKYGSLGSKTLSINGSTSNIESMTNARMSDFYIATKSVKITKIDIYVASTQSHGTVSFGIRKFDRVDNIAWYSAGIVNVVTVFDQSINDGNTTGVQRQYQDVYEGADINDVTITEGQAFTIIGKQTSAGTSNVTARFKIILEAV